MPETFTAILPIKEALACAKSVDFLTLPEQALLAIRTSLLQQKNFIAGRWVLKNLLTEQLGGHLLDWSILPDALGRPKVFFQNLAHAAGVSISHSRSQVLCGLNTVGAIGIDVEDIRPRPNLLNLVARICSPNELTWWQNQPEPLHAFYQLWCAKEAAGKLRGTGLSFATLRTEILMSIADANWHTHDNICIRFLQTKNAMQAIATFD